MTARPGTQNRLARRLCLATAVAHGAAGIGCATLLYGGSFLVSDPAARAAYVAGHPVRWAGGWTMWIVATLGLLAVLQQLGRHAPERRERLADLGFYLALFGALIDLGCQVINACFMPVLAASLSTADFEMWEGMLIHANIYAGNTAYTIGGAMINLAITGAPRVPGWVAALGWPAWLAGAVLTVGHAAGWGAVVAGATGAILVTFTLWMLVLAIKVFGESEAATNNA